MFSFTVKEKKKRKRIMEKGNSAHCGCSVFRLLLTTDLCDVVLRVWRCMAFDLCVRVWSRPAHNAGSFHAPPVFCFFSTHLFPFSPPPSQLYHVIRMNLHRDSPIWRRQGFRKCLKMTQQQQAEFPCLWELHWDKLDFKCGSGPLSLTGGLTLNPDATTQILIPPTLHF